MKEIDAANPDDPLPSSPLKEGERRAGPWELGMGIQQVELDALATLRPDVLSEVVEAAVRPFYDDGVDAEADQIEDDWLDDAEDALDEQLTDELLARWRERARDQLAALLEQSADRPLLLGQLNAALNVLPDEIDLPDLPEAPVGTAAHGIPNPLAHSGMSHFEFLEAVNTRREYLDEAKRKKGDRRASLNP